MPVLAYALAAVIGAGATVVGLAGLLGATWTVHVPWLVPLGGVELALDRLGGLFLALVGAVSLPASLYGLTWERRRGLAAYVVFVASMCLVPLAANALTFLILWELMSLASYALVLGAGATRESVRAAWVYAVMTHAGLACLLAAMLLLGAWTGSLRFEDWRAGAAALSPAGRNFVFALLALGFAGKAGVIPLHVWLPLAHPAAPSHVSALMSGVMIKLGVYGLVRASGDWLGAGPAWWGVVLLLAGAVSAVVGVLYALIEHDLKRLLAFHSIENIGIILIGLGAGMLFQGAGLESLALLGLAAALYHTVNHAVFKSLLFLGAGAVTHATGTRDMEAMGGLIKRMPWTAACFLVGCVAIAGLPPLNGFVSEWVVFQALLRSGEAAGALRVASVAASGLAMIGGLALACFTKVDGVVFLGRPRSRAVGNATERGLASTGPMLALAAACLAIGVYPALAVTPAVAVGMSVATRSAMPAADLEGLGAALPAVTLVALALVLLCWLLWLARGHRLRRVPVATSSTWACAGAPLTARMQYTASSYADPLLGTLRALAGVRRQSDASGFRGQPIDLVLDAVVSPAWRQVSRMAREARLFQAGRLRWYLLYVILTVLALLLYIGHTPGTR
jgi:hydrogenase-4 component B